LVGLLVLVLAAAGWTGIRALRAKGHLQTARAQLEIAKTALLDRRLDDADRAVTKAGALTHQARGLTGDPVTSLLSHLPWLGRPLTVERGIARNADDIARGALPEALRSARALDPKALRRPNGSLDLGVLEKAQPGLAAAAAQARAVAGRVADLPHSFGPFESARKDFAVQTTDLSKSLAGASDALGIAPALLGQDRTRTYFVLVQQTSESRGTGGLPGGFAILQASKGRLHVTQQGSNADLREGQIAPVGLSPDYVKRYDIYGAFDLWQNINLSPDLPVVSRYIAQRWKAQTGQHIDGVIALDAVALADLLQGSGPVQVGAGQSIAPEKLQDYLALGQYAGNASNQTVRKEKLVGVAKAVIDRLTTGGGNSDALLKGLSAAFRAGHLHIAVDDAALAPVLRRTGADGGLPHDDAPFAYPVVYNASGSKLEYFLDRDVSYAGGSCSGGRRRTTVTLRLRTDPPPLAQIPTYVTTWSAEAAEAPLSSRLFTSSPRTEPSADTKANDGPPASGEVPVSMMPVCCVA